MVKAVDATGDGGLPSGSREVVLAASSSVALGPT
eukprot:CAMPEP_0205888832 /NCGR_PEP_ID=MMETSP1083-20121108/20617_1 /ASSEMBLY_ACC=CAM_ASM_000430 /TAXON_ID=97485 /ORGANISM="Prymnesium parvum, Strain Texoma1" /LENGTH=33 /DNA_ID= /DNA_START= /DNA_END= /DNA_ORIENTATION=